MTPNQREDMRRELELEERWYPMNRRQDDPIDWVTVTTWVLIGIGCILAWGALAGILAWIR